MEAQRINNILTAKARGNEALGAVCFYYASVVTLRLEESQAAAFELYDGLDEVVAGIDLNNLENTPDGLDAEFTAKLATATAMRASWEGVDEPEGQVEAFATMLGHLDGVVASLTSARDACKVEGEAAADDADDVGARGPLDPQVGMPGATGDEPLEAQIRG